jgi:hypothetical protein
MPVALQVLIIMLICAVGVASIIFPPLCFYAKDWKSTQRLFRYRWVSLATPFIVIPLLVTLVVSLSSGTSPSVHCGPGTQYVDMGKNAHPSWMCMGLPR